MYRLRLTLSALAALALILTGSAAMQMRAAPAPLGQMVICTGQGAITVPMDAEGQPTGARHPCPDCMVHALSGVLPVGGDLVAEARARGMVHGVCAQAVPGPHGQVRPWARAPPVA